MSALWRVVWDPAAGKDLARIGRAAAERVLDAVEHRLARDPYSGKRLSASSPVHLWRYRIGRYRVIYVIQAGWVRVLVLWVGHRRDVYRRLEQLLHRSADP